MCTYVREGKAKRDKLWLHLVRLPQDLSKWSPITKHLHVCHSIINWPALALTLALHIRFNVNGSCVQCTGRHENSLDWHYNELRQSRFRLFAASGADRRWPADWSTCVVFPLSDKLWHLSAWNRVDVRNNALTTMWLRVMQLSAQQWIAMVKSHYRVVALRDALLLWSELPSPKNANYSDALRMTQSPSHSL